MNKKPGGVIMRIIQGKFLGKDLNIGIVISRFNEVVTEKLLNGAIDCLTRHDLSESNIDVFKVPGSLEMIYVLNQLTKKNYDALIALGAVIRGETYHFNLVANEIGKAVAQYNMHSDVPIVFGVITADTLEQAINRAGAKSGNKGFEAALIALEMANLRRYL